MHMLSPEIRRLALIGDSEGIRRAAFQEAQSPESNEILVDLYKLVADLSDSDFEGASIKCELIGYKYSHAQNFSEIQQILNTAWAQISFAHGNFDRLEELVNREVSNFDKGNSILGVGDILQMLRLRAGKLYIMNEFKELRSLATTIEKYSIDTNRIHVYYFINAIKCLIFSERGEHRIALKFTNINIGLASEYNYSKLIAPLDAIYIQADSHFSMADEATGYQSFEKVKNLALSTSQWPWYFKADGQIARQSAFNGNFSAALNTIREERQLNSSFKFENGLAFLPDANELFVRYLIKDTDRIHVLLNRLPELTLVKQIRALQDEWNGKDISGFINKLPEDSPRERIYKLFALAEYHRETESVAVTHMQQALSIVEDTGAIEFLLRQQHLLEIIIKAVAKSPTPFQEDLVRRLTERVKVERAKQHGNLPIPLTKRELEILKHLVTNETTKSVGEILNISMNTMKTHVRNIYKKLDVDTRAKAIQRAQELFLI